MLTHLLLDKNAVTKYLERAKRRLPGLLAELGLIPFLGLASILADRILDATHRFLEVSP